MNKKEFQETEEALRAYFRKGRTEEPEDYPEFQPDFEDIQRRLEEVDSGKRVLPPLSPTPEEWNRQVRAERRQRARKVASIAAAVVVVIGVAGGAYWLGRESVVVPNPDSSVAESEEGALLDTSASDDTSNRPFDDDVLTHAEAVQLTGLPLVDADDMPGFQGYVVDDTGIRYEFEQGSVCIYKDKSIPSGFTGTKSVVLNNRSFIVEEAVVDSSDVCIVNVLFESVENNVLFFGTFTNTSTDEAVQLLNTLVF